jgi:F-type H+-transporting ATPase subunit a
MINLKKFILNSGWILIFLLSTVNFALASEEEHSEKDTEKEFDAKTFILDHVLDAHEWHIATYTSHGEEKHLTIPLPVILYSKNSGFHIFMSSKLAHGHVYKGFRMEKPAKSTGRIVEITKEGSQERIQFPLDFSITKTVFGMFVAVIIVLWLFLSLAKSYRESGISEPKGLQAVLEPVVLFVRDDIAKLILKDHYEKYLPYLLSAFFFIWINNILGLIPVFPFGANVTGNISVTLVLAVFTFIITQISGKKQYWKHIVATPGVPVWLAPVMIPVEIISIFTKPFALMIRLFANMTAGHMSLLTFIGLIFIFKSIYVAPGSIFFVLFMYIIEILVGFLQAYIFTILSAVFIGQAIAEEH